MLDPHDRRLEYYATLQRPVRYAWLWPIGGIVVTPVLLGISVFLGAAGHGTRGPLLVLFAPSVVACGVAGPGPKAEQMGILISLFYYPLLGLVLFFAEKRGKRQRVLGYLWGMHIASIMVAGLMMARGVL